MKPYIALLASLVLATAAGAAGDITWEHNYDDALVKAKKDKKLVMVDVYTDWCGWCKKLDREVYTDTAVQAALAKSFVSAKINPEKSKSNAQVEAKLGRSGYPHIVFVDADGNKVSEIRGYVPAGKFLEQLEAVTKKVATK